VHQGCYSGSEEVPYMPEEAQRPQRPPGVPPNDGVKTVLSVLLQVMQHLTTSPLALWRSVYLVVVVVVEAYYEHSVPTV
jgi:hypothetical protein